MKFHNVLDIETYDNNGVFVPYCICVIINNKKNIIYKKEANYNIIEDLINLFEKEKVQETIYVHNLTFDGIIIMENIPNKKVKFKAILFKSNIYELELWSNNFKIILKCSLKLLPLPLKKIGKLLKKNYEKLEFPHDFVNKENFNNYIGEHPYNKEISNWNLKEECIKYCIRDCEIVQEMLKIIFNEESLKRDIKGRSISSISLEVFKEKFNKLNIETKIEKKYDKIIREAYFGGRCEIFGNAKQEEKIFHFDFTGMYSEIMKEEFCFGKIKIIDKVNNNVINNPGFYEVTVLSNNMKIPVLPFRSEEGKLLFPNGKWKGTYWYEELHLFIEEGGIIEKIHKIIEFEKTGKPFMEFVEYFKKLRNNSEFENIFWKLFINSIYGRMGMDEINTKTEIVDKKEYKRIENKKEILKEVLINDLIVVTYKKINNTKEIDSNVAIAAAITSKARIKLFKAYKDVIKNKGRLLYSDTDSIFAAYEKDVRDEKHGEIFWDSSKKDTVIEKAIFAIPKGYAVKYKEISTVKIKGFRKDSITYEDFEKTFKNEKELITKEIHLNKSKFKLKFEEIEKTILLHNYDKRIFNENKTETEPIKV